MIKKILDLIFNKEKPVQTALIDTRPYVERQKNWLDIEFAMGQDEYDWKEEDISQPYQIEDGGFFAYNQYISLSCVMLALALWTEEFARRLGRIFIASRRDGYRRRLNYPNGGVAMYDLIRIAKEGVASEEQVPSQGLSETPMNADYTVTDEILETRKKNRIKGAVYITNKNNIDDLAKASLHSPVSIFLAFDTKLQWLEYWVPFPKIINAGLNVFGSDVSRHQVTGISRNNPVVVAGVLINGKKYLKIQDSAGVGTGYGKNRNIRYLSEEFVKYRVYEATYAIPEDVVIEKPNTIQWKGTRNLTLGMIGDDVKDLQKILQLEGCFDFPNPTGYFGGITRAGVIKLQNKYKSDILTPVGLKSGTGYVGKSTLQFIKNKYK